MQDSSGSSNPPSSAVGMFLLFSVATNIMQFFLANDGIRTLETELLKKDQTISQVVAEKNICEGKFIGFTPGEALMSNVYTTAQVAELMGVSADTVRTWKKRNTDKLLEITHWLKDESNALLWTEQGIEVLTLLQKGIEPPEGSNVELPQSSEVDNFEDQTEEVEPLDTPLLSRYEPLLDMIADAVAPRLQQRLDGKIADRVSNLNKKPEPLTAVECVTILKKLGLKPANPAALLTGSKVQSLPESK